MRFPRTPRFFALLVPLLAVSAGCGGKTTDDAVPDTGAPADVGIDSARIDASTDAPSPDTIPDVPLDTIDAAACTKSAAAISALVSGGYCAALVRLSSNDLSVLGWSLDCGPLKVATEADAREVFRPYAGAYSPVESYSSVGPGGPTDDFVFYHSPGDFGGLGVVSRSTSKLVFAGELSWSALGSVRYPTTFHPAGEAPSVCTPRVFPEFEVVNPGGGSFGDGEVARVLLAVDRTPVRRGLEGAAHAVVHSLVVYFPVDGAPESGPAKNEWLVVLDSGLLD